MSKKGQRTKLRGFICVAKITTKAITDTYRKAYDEPAVYEDIYIGISSIAEFGCGYILVHNAHLIKCKESIEEIIKQIQVASP